MAKKTSSDRAAAAQRVESGEQAPPPGVDANETAAGLPAAELPVPSLNDPELLRELVEAEPPLVETDINGEHPSAAPAVELPVTIEPRILRKSLDVLAESMPSIAAFTSDQRELLADVWARPIDDLYQRLWRLLGADPEKLGPWGAAVTVTAALVLPRILPKILKAAGDRFRPQDANPAP